jgi:hypothetical protein
MPRPQHLGTGAGSVQSQKKRRVGPGSYLPRPPTEPDVQISRIRLLKVRIRCGTTNRDAPIPLSAEVSLRRLGDSIFPPSFPPAVPFLATPCPPQGPLGRVPLLLRYYEVLQLPLAHPTSLRCLARRYHAPPVETRGPPRFLGNPLCACPALGPRRDLHVRPWALIRAVRDSECFVARDYRRPCLLPPPISNPSTSRYCLPPI